MGGVENALTPAAALVVTGDLHLGVEDAHHASRHLDPHPGADQPPGYAVVVGVEIDRAVLGPPGVGKTHLAVALGREAIKIGYSVLFTPATTLLTTLARAHAEGRLEDRLAFYAKPKLLIVDELGYLPFALASLLGERIESPPTIMETI